MSAHHFYQIPVVRPRRRCRAREPTTHPSIVPVGDLSGFNAQGVAYTFTPGWSSLTVTTVQNDGKLVATRLPGHRVEPPPPPRPPKLSPAAQRAQALLKARPSSDEELLARLTRKRKTASSEAAPTGPSSKKSGGLVSRRLATIEGTGPLIAIFTIVIIIFVVCTCGIAAWFVTTHCRPTPQMETCNDDLFLQAGNQLSRTRPGAYCRFASPYDALHPSMSLNVERPRRSEPHQPCPVKIIYDPGVQPQKVTKWYLVSGPGAKRPGASSAEAHCTGVKGATSQGYASWDWASLESAWHAACERGEHPPNLDAPVSSSVAPSSTRLASSAIPPPRTPSRKVAPSPSQIRPSSSKPAVTTSGYVTPTHSPSKFTPHDHLSPSASREGLRATASSRVESPQLPAHPVEPLGLLVYAVRAASGVGQVYDDLGAARDLYHFWQAQDVHPVLAVRHSLTEAAAFIGGDDRYPVSPGLSRHRARWIEEELQAFDANSHPPASPSEESDVSAEW
ncbi:hypothetical protein GGX14DRAFT_576188 [Mycena pura]|uniref:Uncharacterized protein n=1 Tax=Mycena pura TaxID=153505 RepID=A0AAD6Y044_9AGAR|nr:hypothetical protein GGX14DRAFT_576188 [Mycena pura]